MFNPISGEYDLIGKHPEAAATVKAVDAYQTTAEELRGTIGPELELIESRIVGPAKEFQGVLKLIRKSITKREHKVSRSYSIRMWGTERFSGDFQLVDYDRFNNSLMKLRDKKEKTLNDEKNLFKVGIL